jgi:hypothetical protein
VREAAGLSENRSIVDRIIETFSFFGEIERETDLEVSRVCRLSASASDLSCTQLEDLAEDDTVGASKRDQVLLEQVRLRGSFPHALNGGIL